jgi:glycolate oxidase FAD binding subunit
VGGRDLGEALKDSVLRAFAAGEPLAIVGSGSKAFLSPSVYRGIALPVLATREHAGIVDYRPEELVVTARAGTPLVALEHALAEAGQMLPFEPPRFGGGGTLGGAVACGLSGPARPWRGAVRDAVLGVELVNGRGERLQFGGQVMKNVAGYDLSRLQAGAFGTLGVLLSVSLKVLPRPPLEVTRTFVLDGPAALQQVRRWARQPWPLSAAAWTAGVLRVRLSGAPAAVDRAVRELGGDAEEGADFWDGLRDHALPFFGTGAAVWRATLPPASERPLDGCLVNWAGAERWWEETGGRGAEAWRREVEAAGGSAWRFDATYGITALTGSRGARRYLARLREAFDPRGVLNPHLVPPHAH